LAGRRRNLSRRGTSGRSPLVCGRGRRLRTDRSTRPPTVQHRSPPMSSLAVVVKAGRMLAAADRKRVLFREVLAARLANPTSRREMDCLKIGGRTNLLGRGLSRSGGTWRFTRSKVRFHEASVHAPVPW
jgi:hypothetical protein